MVSRSILILSLILSVVENLHAQEPNSDSVYTVLQIESISDSIDYRSHRIASYAGYRHVLKLARISPVEGLLSDATLSYVYFGPYGQSVYLFSILAPMMKPGLLIDGFQLYDPQLEDFDISWLPCSVISSVWYKRWPGLESNPDVPAILFEPFSPGFEFPITRIGAWWADFKTRSIDLRFSTPLIKRLGIDFGYENLNSSGWVSNSSSQFDKYFGKIAMPARLGDFMVMVLRYKGYWDLPGGTDRQSNQREQLAMRFKSKGTNNIKIDFSHISNDRFCNQYSSSIGLNQFESTIETPIDSWIGLKTTVGYSSKAYQDSVIEKVDVSDSHASIWIKISQEMTEESLRIGVIRNSLHGTKPVGSLTLDHRWSDSKGFVLNIERSWIFPKVSDFILGRGFFKKALISTGLQSETYFDFGVSRMSGYCFLRKLNADSDKGDSYASEDKIYGGGMELGITPKQGLELVVSYSVAKSDQSRCDKCHLGHVLAWSLDLKKIITQHVSFGLAFPARWVSDYDFERANLDCFEGPMGKHKQYIYATPLVYLEIDRTFCFLRLRNAFNMRVQSPCTRYDLPGKNLEFGMIWHLLD